MKTTDTIVILDAIRREARRQDEIWARESGIEQHTAKEIRDALNRIADDISETFKARTP